jgi:hypothetical protein
LVAAKVYSGEYLIWLAFLVVIPTDKTWLWRVGLVVLAGMLTKRVYSTYDDAISGALLPYLVLALRNASIGAVLALTVRGLSRLAARGEGRVDRGSAQAL